MIIILFLKITDDAVVELLTTGGGRTTSVIAASQCYLIEMFQYYVHMFFSSEYISLKNIQYCQTFKTT